MGHSLGGIANKISEQVPANGKPRIHAKCTKQESHEKKISY